ncbi:hypothetical protein [Anaeromicrobium sp.]|uniref:hypothetical protein n=1 Tax=Anaeromicrobium sp. TaxID=1929132 RepID=UPI0025D0BA10|nr:hypothetical protein [Anaeromicrobium sp.]
MSKNSNNKTALFKSIKKSLYKSRKWVFLITIWTFFLSILITLISDLLINKLNIYMAFLVLLFIISIGILFDLIGVAVTSANEKPFHSMASRKVAGAKQSVKLIRNASTVSNFCNDVIGDICGIVSGMASAVIILKIAVLIKSHSISESILNVFLSGVVASLTVGGKALGKEIGISHSKEIVFAVGKLLHQIKKKFGLNIIKD